MSDENNPDDWFVLAQNRLQIADDSYSIRGATLGCVELLHEAVERYLKGWLIAHEWPLQRTHNLRVLMEEAEQRDTSFEQFLDFADELTQKFFAQHYPGSDLEDVLTDYDVLREQATALITLIQEGSDDTV